MAHTDLNPRPHGPPAPATTDRDHQNWLRMWRKDQTDFHQHSVNPLLTRFWVSQSLPRPGRIFVPLCGKSLDLIWLAAQGNEVIGVELSPVAIKSFFRENGLAARKNKRGRFTVWESGRIRILGGDFFQLTPAELGDIDIVYDRAALTALPEDLRAPYVAHLRAIVPSTCSIFLLTLADQDPADDVLSPVPEDDIDDEIRSLYAPHFDIDMAHREAGLEADAEHPSAAPVAVEHTVYRLTPRA